LRGRDASISQGDKCAGPVLDERQRLQGRGVSGSDQPVRRFEEYDSAYLLAQAAISAR